MKAYAVTWIQMPDVQVFFAASTPGKASYSAFLMLRDTRRDARITDLRTRRAPEWDHLAELKTCDGQRIFEVDAGAFTEPHYLGPR